MCHCQNKNCCCTYDGSKIIYTGLNITNPFLVPRGTTFNEFVQKVTSFQPASNNVSTVDNISELGALDDPNIAITFVVDHQTTYIKKIGSYASDSGAILIQGTTDTFWVPQFYKTSTDGIIMGSQSMPNSDGYFNTAVLKVISQPTSNVGLLSLGTNTAKVSGVHINNVDYNNGSYSPEFWGRGNILAADWFSEAAVTWRAIITGQHTRQTGFGINAYTTGGDPTKFWTGDTDMRDDAVIFWLSNNVRFNQLSTAGLQYKNEVLNFYVTGAGDTHIKGAIFTGSQSFTTENEIIDNASTYVFKGTNTITFPIPDPTELDVWGAFKNDNREMVIVNLGSAILSLSRDIKLDASDTINQLNYMSPNNTLRIKCVAGEWIKIAN